MDKICKECGNAHSRKRSKYCSKFCSNKQYLKEEYRTKISSGRKKFLKENPDKHPWTKHSKFKSIPCERLKEYLDSKNIKYVSEWKPLEDRNFSIDIAFPDIKFGIEVNGNQHYNSDGTLTEYYKNRHDLIESSGWRLLELHYSSCYNEQLIESIIQVKEQPDYTEYFKKKEEKSKKAAALPRGQKAKIKADIKWEPYKELVLNSGIDFSKFGWVKQVAKILSIKDQKVNGWMKRHLTEFYDKSCYKRNAGVSHGASTSASIV